MAVSFSGPDALDKQYGLSRASGPLKLTALVFFSLLVDLENVKLLS